MLTCKECIDVLYDYLEGTLDAELTQHINEHIEACPPCVEFRESYKRVPGLTRTALAQEIPREVAVRLKEALQSVRVRQR